MDKLLQKFEETFRGKTYKHRVSNTGDVIASCLYEDLLSLANSPKLVQRVQDGLVAVNTSNQIKGKKGRRGDGTFGRIIPGESPVLVPDFGVPRAPIATLEVGAEVKIMATKMIAQIDRVISDLVGQAQTFRRHNPRAIAVGIVGVNYADEYTGYEGERSFDARTPPGREAPEIVRRLDAVKAEYDEVLILKYKATNRPPYPFSWVSLTDARLEYRSILVRVSDEYQARF
jgi:hypothetical protein